MQQQASCRTSLVGAQHWALNEGVCAGHKGVRGRG